eukprot:4753952-Pleurochrysis_carterae.AAC.1
MSTTRARVSASRCSRATMTEAGSALSPGSAPVYFPLEKIAAQAALPKSVWVTRRRASATTS